MPAPPPSCSCRVNRVRVTSQASGMRPFPPGTGEPWECGFCVDSLSPFGEDLLLPGCVERILSPETAGQEPKPPRPIRQVAESHTLPSIRAFTRAPQAQEAGCGQVGMSWAVPGAVGSCRLCRELGDSRVPGYLGGFWGCGMRGSQGSGSQWACPVWASDSWPHRQVVPPPQRQPRYLFPMSPGQEHPR